MEKPINPDAQLSEKDFYDKAYSYFQYHAEQRTTMLNFYIGLFGSGVALYGGLIATSAVACILIAGFLLLISLIFYTIDIRTKFDVKQSQEVLCEFEQTYQANIAHNNCAYGVFSNEDNTFELYDYKFRKNHPDYQQLRKLYKNAKTPEERELLTQKIKQFQEKHPTLSEKNIRDSLKQGCIPHLSTALRYLYYICMAVSVIGLLAALLASFGIV